MVISFSLFLICRLKSNSFLIFKSIKIREFESNSKVDVSVGWLLYLFNGIVTGILKGYDALMNLVLDDTVEYLRGILSWLAMIYRFWWPTFIVGRNTTTWNCDLSRNRHNDHKSGRGYDRNSKSLWIIVFPVDCLFTDFASNRSLRSTK